MFIIQGIIYWVHEFEEYIYPSGFLDYFNRHAMGSKRGDYPLTTIGSFWINIPLVYIAMPFSAVLAHFFGLAFGLWTAYFSALNALSHVGMAVIFKNKYNPGLIASVFLNIPFGIYTVWYFVSHNLVSTEANIISLIVVMNYKKIHGLNTVRQIISRYAPPNEDQSKGKA